MYKLSEIIAKPVYSIFEGVLVGTIVGTVLENKTKKVKAFSVLSIDEETESFLSPRDIFVQSENCLLIRNVTKLKNIALAQTNLIGKKVLSFSGEDFGNIKEVFFDEKFNMLSVETTLNGVLNKDVFVSFGEDATFVSLEKNVLISRFKPRSFISREDIADVKVSILNENNFNEIKIGSIGDNSLKSYSSVPVKIAKNPSFLLGRKCKSTIVDTKGEVIVREGEVITEKAISKAQINNKIYELSVSAI